MTPPFPMLFPHLTHISQDDKKGGAEPAPQTTIKGKESTLQSVLQRHPNRCCEYQKGPSLSALWNANSIWINQSAGRYINNVYKELIKHVYSCYHMLPPFPPFSKPWIFKCLLNWSQGPVWWQRGGQHLSPLKAGAWPMVHDPPLCQAS